MKKSDYYLLLTWICMSECAPRWINILFAFIFGATMALWMWTEKKE